MQQFGSNQQQQQLSSEQQPAASSSLTVIAQLYNVEVWTYKNSVIRKQLHQTQSPPPERNIYDIRPEHKWIPKPNLNARKTQKHSKPWSRWDHQRSPTFGKKARLPGKASPQLNIAISLKKARLCLLAVSWLFQRIKQESNSVQSWTMLDPSPSSKHAARSRPLIRGIGEPRKVLINRVSWFTGRTWMLPITGKTLKL